MDRNKVWLFLLLFLLSFGALPCLGESQVMEKILPNGLKLLLLEDHKAPIVSFQIWYRTGSRNEIPGLTGISHLLEHMMFKGTKKFGPKAFSKIVAENGGNDNAFTSEDYTCYFENIAADRVTVLMDLESDRMVNALFDPKEFASEREVVKEERRLRTEDQPSDDLYEEVAAAAFKAHPYQWPVVGWMGDLENITREDLRRYYQKYYAPGNATLIVVGDFQPEKILPLLTRFFGGIPGGKRPLELKVAEPPQRGERRVEIAREAKSPTLLLAYHAPNFQSQDAFSLEVLSAVLLEGKSSRLYRVLEYEKGLGFVSGGYERMSKDPELFTFSLAMRPGKDVTEGEKVLLSEIERIKNEAVPDKELEKAKNQLEAQFIMGRDSAFFQGYLLGRYETIGSWREIDRYLPGIRNVTAGDLQRVARTYLARENRTVGILYPKEAKP